MAEIAQTFSIDPYAAERSKIARQQKFAELLQSQALQPNEKFSYAGIEAPISAAGGLAKALQAGMSGYLQGDAARKEDELVGKYEKRDAERQSAANEFLVDLQRGKITPERDFGSTDMAGAFPLAPGAVEQDGRAIVPEKVTPYSAQERQAKAVQALGSNNQYLAQVAPMVYASAGQQIASDADREFRAGESAENRLARKLDNQAVLDARAADSKLALDARIAEAIRRGEDRKWEIEQRLNDTKIGREEGADLKRELAKNAADLQREIAGIKAASPSSLPGTGIQYFEKLQELKKLFPPDEDGNDSPEVAEFRALIKDQKLMNLGDRLSLVSTSTGEETGPRVRIGVSPDAAPDLKAKQEAAKAAAIKATQSNFENYEQAAVTFDSLEKLDRTLDHLRTSEAITGMGSDILKNIESVKTLFLNDKAAGKKVSDTEILGSLLGSDVFPMITSLGIGARGLDTPAERTFLLRVMTGDISMNKDTLIQLTQARRDIAQRVVDKFNQRVNKGELDTIFRAMGREPTPFAALGSSSPDSSSPPISALTEGVNTTFGNRQVWTLKNGIAVKVN